MIKIHKFAVEIKPNINTQSQSNYSIALQLESCTLFPKASGKGCFRIGFTTGQSWRFSMFLETQVCWKGEKMQEQFPKETQVCWKEEKMQEQFPKCKCTEADVVQRPSTQ